MTTQASGEFTYFENQTCTEYPPFVTELTDTLCQSNDPVDQEKALNILTHYDHCPDAVAAILHFGFQETTTCFSQPDAQHNTLF